MTLPTNDEFANCELSLEELDAIAAGGFWSGLKHFGEEFGKVMYYVGFGTAIFGGIFGGIQAAAGALPQQNPNANMNLN